MRWPHPIIVLLIVASLLLDGCAWFAAKEKLWPAPAVMFFMALAISQTSLLATWAALGSGRWWVRVSIAIAVVALLGWPVRLHDPDPENRSAGLFAFEIQAVMIIGLLSISRILGRKFRSPQNEFNTDDSAKPKRPWQYSIADLLLVTTAWAMLLAIAKQMPMPSNAYGPLADLLSAAVFAPLAAALVIAVFYDIALWARLLLLAVISAESLWLARYIDTGAQSTVFATFFLAVECLTCGALLCVRAAGYRLVRTLGRC